MRHIFSIYAFSIDVATTRRCRLYYQGVVRECKDDGHEKEYLIVPTSALGHKRPLTSLSCERPLTGVKWPLNLAENEYLTAG